MYNTDLPTRAELPSTGKLLRSTLMAVVIAVALLISVVLPAEYAIDPTGAGRLLGLTEMGEIKTQLAEEAELDQASVQQASEPAAPQEAVSDSQPSAATATAAPTSDVETEQVAASLPEDQEMVQTEANVALADAPAAEETPSQATEETAAWGDEVTFTLTPGEGTEYKLTMEEGAVATFAWASDGGPLNFDTHGDGNGNSISYEKGRGVPEDEGELEAAFTGNHGWFFRNRNDNDVTVVLRVGGDYGELKGML
ncbi:hypothetical protein DQ400_15720 [Vreelandella sulfidaeris]|jgi:hypothetical protein|uniref:Transmembrane anchor protein n=2 Tax=Vreelandella TaxID=3137766 RepID=A0A365TK82_9GAMM|nr:MULTISPECIES: hypothetical protein [Halomonas]NVF15428.1 hypothetical protein [Halomonas maris]RBI66185.1 hypothetical protein DQ400_15720 [Halomonas sulfidaeris]|tara:strand:- start:1781 stop:2542 length:762 start_codon:yes stop_codon:yes gene_type:complete